MIDFNDLIPSKPKTEVLDFEDLVPKQKREFEVPPEYEKLGVERYRPPTEEPISVAEQAERPPIDYSDLLESIPGITPGTVEDPSKPPEGITFPEKLAGKPKVVAGEKLIGVKEQAGRIDWTERGPFSPVGLLKAQRLQKAIGRLQDDNYEGYVSSLTTGALGMKEQQVVGFKDGWPITEEVTVGTPIKPEDVKADDKKLVSDYLKRMSEESERGMTFGAKVLTGVSHLPAWMVEFMSTGGLKTIGSKAVGRVGTKLLGKWAATKAGQAALKTGQWLGGAAVRTTAGMPHRVGEEVIKRRIPKKMHFGPKGEFVVDIPGEDWATAIAKGWGTVFIEAASEEAGAAITKGLSGAISKMPFGKTFLTGLRKAWAKRKPGNKTWDFWQKIFAKGGYSNIIGEIGEERLATIMHSIANTQDFGTGKDSGVFDRLAAGLTQDVKNFPVEAAVLSTPAATRFALAKATAPREAAEPPTEGVTPAEPTVEPVKPADETTQPEVYSSTDTAPVAKQKFDAYWKWHKEAGHGDKPTDLKDAIFDYLTEQQVYQDIEQPLFELDDKGQYNSPEGQKLQAKLDKMKAELLDKVQAPTEKPATIEPKAARPETTKTFNDWLSQQSTRSRAAISEYLKSGDIGKAVSAYRDAADGLYGGDKRSKDATEAIIAFAKDRPDWPGKAKPTTEPAVEPEPQPEVKPHAVDILPRKAEILAEIKEAIAKAPSESEVRSKLNKEIPEPASTLPTAEWQKATQDKAKQISEAVDKIKAQKITFAIGSGANVINTKEALQTFYNSVSKLKEKETIPRRPTPKAKSVGKPVAAKKEEIEGLIKAPEGYFTDGRIVIKGDPPAKAKYAEPEFGKPEKSISKESIEEILANYTEPADFMHYAFHSEDVGKGVSGQPAPGAAEEVFAVFKSQGKYYVYRQGKFNVIRNRYPDAQYGIYPKTGQLTAYDQGKPVAAVMPIDTDKGPARDKPPVDMPLAYEEGFEPSLFFPTVEVESTQAEKPEPKHISNIVVDTFRSWPKGIKKVGKDYWTEVMAVAKSFMTPLRYKALRQTQLGVFRFKKPPVSRAVGIELQDVRDALSATHEVGHDLDWQLNKGFPRSIKLRFGDPEAKEMKLRDELKKISKIIRPDIWQDAKGTKYASRHTELMADFISHYILDPEGTKKLAPTMSRLFEAKLATNPQVFDAVSKLQQSRYEGPVEPPIAEHIRETFPLKREFTPLQLIVDMTNKDYVKAAEDLGITAARHYKLLMERARRDAERIDSLVPDKARQADLVVIAEKGSKNPWTGKTRQQILSEKLRANDHKAIKLFRAYQELARQTVNKYLRGADTAEYIKFIDDYFVHAYHTPMTEKYKTAISRWAKKSPQAKKRVLPDLAAAVEMGLKPRAKTLSDGLLLWAGMNYRVATNKAFLRILPKVTNEDGISILQKPQDFPMWPTVEYWPIRQTYAVPLSGRGVLLFQGRVAVDPKVKPFIDALFGRRSFSTPVRIIEGFNAVAKAFELTLFSFFHHQAEFFSAAGSLGPRAMPFVGGYYGKRAQAFGKKPKLWGLLPAHITTLKAGKQLEKTPEFMDDYIAAGGQIGYISTEGIGLIERALKNAADYLEQKTQKEPISLLTGAWATAYAPVRAAEMFYSAHQKLLWDNVQRAKLVAYYNIVADGAKYSDLPMKKVKETAAKYIADNFGGQEWLNTMFRKPKVRQFWTQLWMSLDWTWSQIKTARWPFMYGGKTPQERARRALMRKIGRHHWFWYSAAIAGFTIAGNYAMSGKGPWENEMEHKLDIDWTKIWRSLPWNWDWKERGDYNRRYIGLGKAGRELIRWVTSPLRAFGYKLSPGARTLFEQATGYNMGSKFPEPWAREDMALYKELYHRFGNLMEKFKPFSFSGNNAFLAFPSRKGMTDWKATRAYEEIYKAKANIAMGGISGKIAKANQILKKDEQKLRAEITDACKLNNVDAQNADRLGLTVVRRKYYHLFWKATTLPEKKAVKLCNDYANALLELGVTPKGFKQSLRYRSYELPEKAKRLGIDTFIKAAQKKHSKTP